MRTPVPFFVSYAHLDSRIATTFINCLTEQLAPSGRYDYALWRDTELLVGDRWHDEIVQALDACQLGLLLISPAFLASDYITRHELPRFVGNGAKSIIPVMLKAVSLQRHDLKGLDQYQIFRLDNVKPFADCTTDATRRRFAEGLFGQIESRLDRLFGNRS